MEMKPSFWDSPYFHADTDHWWMDDKAPKKLKKEFEEYMKEEEELKRKRIFT